MFWILHFFAILFCPAALFVTVSCHILLYAL